MKGQFGLLCMLFVSDRGRSTCNNRAAVTASPLRAYLFRHDRRGRIWTVEPRQDVAISPSAKPRSGVWSTPILSGSSSGSSKVRFSSTTFQFTVPRVAFESQREGQDQQAAGSEERTQPARGGPAEAGGDRQATQPRP